jgi:hypothetical protein
MLYALPEEDLKGELDRLIRREVSMVPSAFPWRWINVKSPAGPVRALADKCIAAIACPIEWKDRAYTLEVSIGIAVSGPEDDLDSLLAAADKAMYEAKRRGCGGYALAADAWVPSSPPAAP